MSTEQTSILDSLGPARRFADPSTPTAARRMAASGALPLPPPQIATVLFALTLDSDAEVREKASTSLERLPDAVVDAALAAAIPPALLASFAERYRDDEARLEKIALNGATSDETYCFLATRPFARIVDIVAQNQVRLLRCPSLLDALGENPVTGQATIDRILHFLGLERSAAEETDESAMQEGIPPSSDAPALDPVATEALEDPSDLPPELVEEPDKDVLEGSPDSEEAQERRRGLAAIVQDMSVMDKIKLARFGNMEARGLLVRERNRLVATAVIRSPKITESEITAFAKSRNLHDEVIRIIANNREWTRSYAVKLALATNPKAPPTAAIKFLNFLTDRDLQTIMRSRDVPGPVSQQARRILIRKGKS